MASAFVKRSLEAKTTQIVEILLNCLLLQNTFYLFLFTDQSLLPRIAFCKDVYVSEKLDLAAFHIHFA